MYKIEHVLQNMPTSKLVLYGTFSKQFSAIEYVKCAYDRMIKKYKLDEEAALNFLDTEKTIILQRGDNLDGYHGDSNCTVEEMLKQCYQSIKWCAKCIPADVNFNSLTFSELAKLFDLTTQLSDLYKAREKRKQKQLEKSTYMQFDKLASEITLEQDLMNFYRTLSNSLSEKIAQRCGYDKSSLLAPRTAILESALSLQNADDMQVSLDEYKSSAFNSSERAKALIMQYPNIKYPFSN